MRWSMNGKSEPNNTRCPPTRSIIPMISGPVICEPHTSSHSDSCRTAASIASSTPAGVMPACPRITYARGYFPRRLEQSTERRTPTMLGVT